MSPPESNVNQEIPPTTPEADHAARLARLAGQLDAMELDAVLILQNVDLFYFTGSVPNAVLAVSPEGRFVLGVIKGLGRARRESSLPDGAIREMRSYRDIPSLLEEIGVRRPARIGLEQDVLPMAMGQRLLRYLPGARAEDISAVVRRLRAVKDPSEQSAMREAARRLGRIFEEAAEVIAVGRTELEVAADLERRMRLLGHQGLVRMRRFNGELYYGSMGTGRSTGSEHAFDGPVGVAGLYPAVPQLAGPFRIRSQDTFMLDLVFGVAGYLVDAARLYTLGAPAPMVRRAHEVALQIQRESAEAMVPGALPEDIYHQALARAKEAGLQAGFMGSGPNQVRFLAHGVGLEIDELPVIAAGFTDPLEEGMALAVEPKFFFDKEASAGIENTFIVKAAGPAECLIEGGHEIRVL